MKLTYAVVYEQTPDNYCAYVPDLPGCIGTGKTGTKYSGRWKRQLSFTSKAHWNAASRFRNRACPSKRPKPNTTDPLTEEERDSLVPFPDSQSTLPATYGTVEVEVGVSSGAAGGS